MRRYRINLELNLLRFLTKFPYSNGQKTSKNAPKIGQKTVFCDFDRGNSVLLSPNHFKSILWSKIRLGKCIRSVWCTEQKIPVSSKSFYYSSYHIHKTCESMEGETSTTKSSEYSTRISSSIAVTVNVIHTSLYILIV